MFRRTCTTLAAAALGLCLACTPEPERPNVLLITIDTLRADRLGTYGYERPTSPSIDAFAETAVVFDEANSSASWTLPGLASLMTAHYAKAHKCTQPLSRLDRSHRTLAELMRDAGYDTALVACHLFQDERFGLQQGFTHVDDELIRSSPESGLSITSPQVSDKGIGFLEEKAAVADGIPWMLWLHYFDPHAAYLPHEGYSEQFGLEDESDLYDGEIAFTDHHVGRVLSRLDELGFSDDTIVVLVSDHGEEFGEHGSKQHGYNLYRETVRVPLMMRVPGIEPRRVESIVSVVNVKPTLLELVGLAPEMPIEGEGLSAMLRGRRPLEVAAVSEVSWHEGQDMRSLRKGRWTYYEHRMHGQARDLLYDRSADVDEHRDVSRDEPEILASLREELTYRLEESRIRGLLYDESAMSDVAAGDLARLQQLGYVGTQPEKD